MRMLLAIMAGILCFVASTMIFDAVLSRVSLSSLEDLSLVWSESTVGEPLPFRSWVLLALETALVFLAAGLTVGLLCPRNPRWPSLMTAALALIPTVWALGALLVYNFSTLAWAPFLMRLILGPLCALAGALFVSAIANKRSSMVGDAAA